MDEIIKHFPQVPLWVIAVLMTWTKLEPYVKSRKRSKTLPSVPTVSGCAMSNGQNMREHMRDFRSVATGVRDLLRLQADDPLRTHTEALGKLAIAAEEQARQSKIQTTATTAQLAKLCETKLVLQEIKRAIINGNDDTDTS